MVQDVQAKLNSGLPWQSSTQQVEGSFHQQTELKFKEGTSKVVAGRGFDSRWCHWNFSVT
jgi:hypothetical protein